MVNTGQMLRQISLIPVALVLLAPAQADSPAASDPRPECIEAVARVRILAYHPTELGPLDDDEIVISWTWNVEVDVKEVYLGDIPRGKLTIGITLHTTFDAQLHQPVFSAPTKAELSPQGWLPQDYANWLRPVTYRRADVRGFSDPHGDYGNDTNWVSMQKGRVIAKRGFDTKDIPAMLAERRSLECVSDGGERAP
jgi:hypothetical protein